MWARIQGTAATTLIGAALVVAGVHSGHPASNTAPAAATADYQPPAFRLPDTSRAHVRVVAPVRKPAARPRPARRLVQPVAAPVRPAAVHRTARPAHRTVTHSTSFTEALNAAVARIPTYRTGAARWVVSRKYDFWGTADWYHDVLYVSPDVPRDKLYDVAVHEWSHELSVLDYGGDVNAATKAMNSWFGGSDLTGAERAADCMAILQGATWTHYTTCDNSSWRKGAAKLVAGQQL